jgi:hypothetical protein
MDGVFIGGCHLNDCHYVTNGNYDALAMVQVCTRLLGHIGVNPERLRLEWVSAGEGIRFANVMNEYGARVQKLGPLGRSEGLDPKELGSRLAAATRIVPFLRLALAERLRPAVRTEEAYQRFFRSAEFDRLFEELVLDKLETSRMMLLLGERPRSMGEIAERLGVGPSEVARRVGNAAQQGWVRYDPSRRCYSLA